MPAKKTKIIAPAQSVVQLKPAKKTRKWGYVYWILIVVITMVTCYGLSKIDDGSGTGLLPELSEEKLRGEPVEQDASTGSRESGKQKLLEGDAVGALNDFSIAIEQNPNMALNYIYRGEVLMAGSNFDAAIADFDSAIKLEPSVIAYYDRAIANIKLENLLGAKDDLDKSLEEQYIYPETQTISMHDIYSKRAQVNLWLRNWADAESDYTSAIAQSGGGELDWNDYTGRAEARTNRGDYENAVQDYVAAVTIISDKIQKTPDDKTRENMSRQAMGFFEKSGALRVKMGQMDLAFSDLQAAHTLAIALNDIDNKNRLQILMASIK